MPHLCCVPGCRSNYKNEPYTTIFKFPKEETMRKNWVRAIHRENYSPSDSAVVCVKHFCELSIIKEDVLKRSDGTTLIYKRQHPKLTKNAIPTIFPNLPTYLSKAVPEQREGVHRREVLLEEHNERILDKFNIKDKILSFSNSSDLHPENLASNPHPWESGNENQASNSADQQTKSHPESGEVSHTKKILAKRTSSNDFCAPPPEKKVKTSQCFFCNDQSLEEFIISHSKTCAIYENYTHTKSLTSDNRGRLVAAIVDGLLDRHDKVSKNMFIELAENIVEVFPTETKETYYYNKEVSKNARGKIPDKYHNERSRRRKCLKLSSDQETEGTASNKAVKAEVIDNTNTSKMDLLLSSSEPLPTVVKTDPIRIKHPIEDASHHTFITKGPTLHNLNGHAPIKDNFELQYPPKSNTLVSGWDDSSKLLEEKLAAVKSVNTSNLKNDNLKTHGILNQLPHSLPSNILKNKKQTEKPLIRESSDVFITCASESGRVRLSANARNSRQRKDRELPCVVSKQLKRKFNDNQDKVTDGSKLNQHFATTKPIYGLINYRPSTEDDCSVLQHIELMKSQCEKATHHVRKISRCMDLTLHHRRQLILQENVRIPAILKMYPTLCDPMQICYEFERIANVDICTVIVEKMKEYCRPILRLRKLVLEDILEGISSEDQVDVLSSRAILELPHLLSEVVDFDAPPSKETAPMLHFSDSPFSPGAEGVLRAEGAEVCRFRGLVMGACVWLASYYVFNCLYPARCKNTLLFLQRTVLGPKVESKMPLKVLTLIQEINRLENVKG